MSRRTFGVAIGLPEPFAGQLREWRERLGDPNAAGIPPHVTLLPPTALPDDRLDDVEAHLLSVAAAAEPFGIHLRGSGTFRPVSPVVFVPLVEGVGPCEQLEAGVRSGPLHREVSFPYHPHVTVAHELPDPALDRAFAELSSYDAQFEVWGFTLFEQGRDAVWRPQRDFALGATGPGPVHEATGQGRGPT